MSKEKTIQMLKHYQKAPAKQREDFLRAFEETMIYRTTKTENPSTTLSIVKETLNNRKKDSACETEGDF
ncbi:MAG: hypothetical protein Q8O13_10575 [Candidatus Omnitrophota bacterium]|nr:hypothetical protein [Candidatus Omnitrophota bacterium]